MAYNKIEEVSADVMRAVFNASIKPHLDELIVICVRSRTPRTTHLPKGTKSNYYHIVQKDGTKIAEAHAYQLPNGQLAYAGLDPKQLILNDILYTLDGT